jgi:ubiquinone/menaquinone biosynthesis C-methylase UbiE
MGEHANTYFVQDRKNKKDELIRLTIQDQMLTAAMGGALPEQTDPTVFRHVLDVACGTGGWIVEAAQTYPQMSLVGIDISQQMIRFARTQVEGNPVADRIEFHVMDALQTLDFPAASFDLVNLRFGLSFLRTWDWPQLLGGLLRVTRPGGVIRLTENQIVQESNSRALTRLCEMTICAFFRAGHLFTQETAGLTSHLPRLLNHYGCKGVQTKTYGIEYRADTTEGKAYFEDVRLVFQTLYPFIEKWGCASQDYKTIYRQALEEMCQPDFCVKWNLVTTWGYRP